MAIEQPMPPPAMSFATFIIMVRLAVFMLWILLRTTINTVKAALTTAYNAIALLCNPIGNALIWSTNKICNGVKKTTTFILYSFRAAGNWYIGELHYCSLRNVLGPVVRILIFILITLMIVGLPFLLANSFPLDVAMVNSQTLAGVLHMATIDSQRVTGMYSDELDPEFW